MSDPSDAPVGWLEVSRQVEGYVRRYFRRRPEVDPDEITQEVLFQLLRRCRGNQPVQDLQALAQVIARRRCIDALRHSYAGRLAMLVEERSTVSPWAEPEPSPQAQLETSEVRSILLKTREQLTPRCRTVLDQLLLGLRLEEVAKVMGTTAGAVRNRWFWCRQQIRRVLSGWGLEKEDLVG